LYEIIYNVVTQSEQQKYNIKELGERGDMTYALSITEEFREWKRLKIHLHLEITLCKTLNDCQQ